MAAQHRGFGRMTPQPAPLPETLGSTRRSLHRVAVHILARRRFAVTGRFGLRASPGGFGTPAFGDGPEALRIAGPVLVREVGGNATHRAIDGSSLDDLAAFVGVDLTEPFESGTDTPAVGDARASLAVDRLAVDVLADWYALGWKALDRVVTELPAASEPVVIQLWPEHFDAGTNVALSAAPSSERVNLGVSPGDAYEDEPYLYVGPWGFVPRTDVPFWNAPFGATLRWTDVQATSDPQGAGVEFLRAGLRHAAQLATPSS
jgi:hypothetical protein